MSSFNILLSSNDVQRKVQECSQWIDGLISSGDSYTICPILQSSYQFAADVSKCLVSTPSVDFFGVQRYVDGEPEDLYVYKGADHSLINGRYVIILDVLVGSGTTLNLATKMIQQMGALKVYSAALLSRQFSKRKADWVGMTISDEVVLGYGLDYNGSYRTLPALYYI